MIENIKELILFNFSYQAKVTINFFSQDLETLFLEKDIVTTGFIIKDKSTVKYKNILTKEITWPALVILSSQEKVFRLFKDLVLIENTQITIFDIIPILNLDCKAIDFLITTICQVVNLSKRENYHSHHIQKSHNKTYTYIN